MKKILVVGFGSIGKRHVDNLLRIKNVKIILCTKRKDIKIKKMRKNEKSISLKLDSAGINPNRLDVPFGNDVKIFHSLEKCLDEKPDIGFITNETSYHTKILKKLSDEGLDLFIEKPVSDSINGLKKISQSIIKKKIISQVGCNFRFHPCIKKMKDVIEKNSIGRIISVQLEHGSFLPDYHPWEDYQSSYASQKRLGGGVILSQIHDLDYLYWIFGDVKEIFAISGKFSDLKGNTEDLASVTLRFKSNVIGHMHIDWFQRPYFRSCKIKGTKGIVYWDSDSNKVKIFNQKKNQWKTILDVKNYQKNSMYIDEIKHFIKCVKLRKKTINTIDDGIRTLELSLAIKKSSNLKKTVKP